MKKKSLPKGKITGISKAWVDLSLYSFDKYRAAGEPGIGISDEQAWWIREWIKKEVRRIARAKMQ